jgi:hypothetical protein
MARVESLTLVRILELFDEKALSDSDTYATKAEAGPFWVQITQAAYNALGTKDPQVLYVIVG